MVGVNVPRLVPAEFINGRLRRRPNAGGFGLHDQMLTVGLVPDRDDLHAAFRGQLKGLELCSGLLGEAISHANGKSPQLELIFHIPVP